MSRKKSLEFSIFLAFVLIFCAFANASFRITSSGMSSLFRLASPFFALYILFRYFAHFKKYIFIVLLLCFYSLVVSLAFWKTVVFEAYVFGIYLFILFVIVEFIKIRTKNQFGKVFFSFLNVVFILTIVICCLEFLLGINMPNTTKSSAIHAYFDNENELCAALACMSIIYFYHVIFSKRYVYLAHVLIALLIIYFDDAKLSLLGAVLGFGALIVFFLIRKISMKRQLSVFIFISFVLAIFIMLASKFINIRGYNLFDMLVAPVKRIISLNPIDRWDSIGYRTNAIIYGITGLINTFFVGVGFGHADTVLNGYLMGEAISMHNIIVQFVVEFGIVALIIYILIIKRLVTNFKKSNSRINVLKLVFALSFILISSQSSQGILSNYYVWTIVLFIALLPINCVKREKKKEEALRTPAVSVSN